MHTQETHKATFKQSYQAHEVLHVPKNAYYSRYFGGSSTKTIELILFILGSWLVTDVDAFFLLMLASLNLMVVDEEDAVLLSH
jgi:hypothetical protein